METARIAINVIGTWIRNDHLQPMVSARYPPNEAPTLFPVAKTMLRTPTHSMGERGERSHTRSTDLAMYPSGEGEQRLTL